MTYTDPVLPLVGVTAMGDSITLGNYAETHRLMHTRHLTAGTENVLAHGAHGTGSGDDTPYFLKAINNLKAKAPLSGGKLIVPAGYYIVDGDQIIAALANVQGWVIQGEGQLSTTINPKSGTSCAFGIDGAVNCAVRDITFQGESKGGASDGFRLYGNSRSNTFDNVRFNNALNGMHVMEDPAHAGQDQNERNVFINCAADNSTRGYYITGTNAQGQLFIGGGSSACTTAFHGSAGWAEFHSWFGTSATTCWKTDSGFLFTTLDTCLDEGCTTSVALGNGTLIMRNTFLQGATNTILSTTQKFIDATYCTFNTGAFTVGDNSVFYDRQNTFNSVTFSTGTNSTRHKFAPEGYYLFFNDATWTTHKRFDSVTGYIDLKQIAKPSAPASTYNRMYALNASGKLTNQDSAGTESALY